FCLLAVALPIACLATWKTLDWIRPAGLPFPGVFVMENGIVPTVGLYHWTGMTHGMPFAARVIAVDGHPVHSSTEGYALAAAVPVGSTVEYTIDHDGSLETRRVPTMLFRPTDYFWTLGLFVIDGFMGLAAAFVVSLLKPRSPAARGFL